MRCGGSEDAQVSRLGVYFGTTHDEDEKVFCGRMQPTEAELAARGFSHKPDQQTLLALNYISATHFSIERKIDQFQRGKYEITDRSRNGTIVNGRVLNTGETMELREKDKVSFKFKNEIKLEYIWTTTETGFAERKDSEAGKPRVAQVPEGDRSPGAPSDKVGAASVRETMDSREQEQAGTLPPGQRQVQTAAPAIEANGNGNSDDKVTVSAPPAPEPAPLQVPTGVMGNEGRGADGGGAAAASASAPAPAPAPAPEATSTVAASTSSANESRNRSRSDSLNRQDSAVAEPSSEVAMYIDQINDYQQENKGLEGRNKQLQVENEKLSVEAFKKQELQKKLSDTTSRLTDIEKQLSTKAAELHEMTLKYNNLVSENRGLVTKVENRDKQLATSRLQVASTSEKRKMQASARKEVEGEFESLNRKVKQLQDFNFSLATMLTEERRLHKATFTEALKVVEDSTAGTGRALSSLHSDMIAQNEQRMGGGALESTLRNAINSIIPNLTQTLANEIEDKDKALLAGAETVKLKRDAGLKESGEKLRQMMATLDKRLSATLAVEEPAANSLPSSSSSSSSGAKQSLAASMDNAAGDRDSIPFRAAAQTAPSASAPAPAVAAVGAGTESVEVEITGEEVPEVDLQEFALSQDAMIRLETEPKLHHKTKEKLQKQAALAQSLSPNQRAQLQTALSSPSNSASSSSSSSGSGGKVARLSSPGKGNEGKSRQKKRKSIDNLGPGPMASQDSEPGHRELQRVVAGVPPQRASAAEARNRMSMFVTMDEDNDDAIQRLEENDSGGGDGGNGAKKKRGRKTSESSSLSQASFSNVFDDGMEGGPYFNDLPMSTSQPAPGIGGASPPVKRKPGRPRKNPLVME